MKVKELIDNINESDGDITAININDDEETATLRGVAGSTDILLKAIDTITVS